MSESKKQSNNETEVKQLRELMVKVRVYKYRLAYAICDLQINPKACLLFDIFRVHMLVTHDVTIDCISLINPNYHDGAMEYYKLLEKMNDHDIIEIYHEWTKLFGEPQTTSEIAARIQSKS